MRDNDEIRYYINLSVSYNLGYRELASRTKNKEYNILPLPIETRIKKNSKSLNIKDLVSNPILIKNKNNIDIINEKSLHNLISEYIESFMHELRNNSSFIGSEYKIKIGDNYHKIDLLLFNIKYNAYVLVELKVTEFKVEYILQVQKYMNYMDNKKIK